VIFLDPRRLVGESAVDVWVDEQGRVRRRVATSAEHPVDVQGR
jgi:hypothetical protein